MRKYLWTLVSVMAILTACSDSKQTTGKNPYYPEEADEDTAFVTLEEAGGDSMLVGSSLYSQTERDLKDLLYETENVRSTYMLQLLLMHYDEDIQKANKKVAEAESSGLCTAEEIATLRTTLDAIQDGVEDKWYDYAAPAVGVIGNLNYLIRSVNSARSKAELEKTLDRRTGYLQTLPTLHLVVQEPSQQKEVHRLAKELQRTIERKRAELR